MWLYGCGGRGRGAGGGGRSRVCTGERALGSRRQVAGRAGAGWCRSDLALQALLGFRRNLTHLDGRVVELRRGGVTQPGGSRHGSVMRCAADGRVSFFVPGYVQTIKDEGMPIFEGTGYGDLYVEYSVVLPAQLSPGLRKSKRTRRLHARVPDS